MFHILFRRTLSFSLSKFKIVQFNSNVQIKRTHSFDYVQHFVKTKDVKDLFEKIQNGELLLKEHIPNIDNAEINKYMIERGEIMNSLSSLLELDKDRPEEDEDLKSMLEAEVSDMEEKLFHIECQLLDAVTPQLPKSNEVILEISAGVGGQEAMLFTKSLYDMYCGYIEYRNWSITTEEVEVSDLGGLRHASLFIEGDSALTYLRQESGVHRVQRVPVTEKSGRIHTSTASVAVLLQPKEIDVNLNQKDLVIETKRASGAGGQHVNKTESAVRIVHLPTGIAVDCQVGRSQIKNKEIAFQKLYAKLYDIQQKEQITSTVTSRKLQMGTSSRSDKIRTYNFPQDRVTDHRILRTVHNIPIFLQGGEALDSLISDLILESEKNRYEQFLLSLKELYNTTK